MFGRKKRVPVRICPQCGHEFREESAVCPLCNYDTGRRLLDQEETVDDDDKMDLLESLLGESGDSSETDESDVTIDAWSIKDLSYDDLEIVVDQYDDDGTVMITAQGPSFAEVSQEVVGQDASDDLDLGEILGQSPAVPEDVDDTEFVPSSTSMTSRPVESQPVEAAKVPTSADEGLVEDDDLDDFLDDLESTNAEDEEINVSRNPSPPLHSVTPVNTAISDEIPSAVSVSTSSTTALPKATVVTSGPDEDLPTASVVKDDEQVAIEHGNAPLPSASPLKSEASPETTTKAHPMTASVTAPLSTTVAATPSAPDSVSRPPHGSIPSPVGVWPWPQHPSGASPTKRREMLKIALEAVKSGNLAQATAALDRLGPVLGDDIDLIFHVGLLLKRLGRSDQLQTMLTSARDMYPENEHVHRALGALV